MHEIKKSSKLMSEAKGGKGIEMSSTLELIIKLPLGKAGLLVS